MKQYKKNSGFSLIELMLVVSIIAILAGIAIPNYQGYITKSRRVDAQGALSSFANAMERYYTENYTYLGASTVDADDDLGAPDIYSTTSPVDGTPYYNLTIDAATATTYTLRATPIGSQIGDGYLEVTSTGLRRWDRNNNNAIENPNGDGHNETTW